MISSHTEPSSQGGKGRGWLAGATEMTEAPPAGWKP
jgi:hypothetical protein